MVLAYDQHSTALFSCHEISDLKYLLTLTIRWFLPTSLSGQLALARQQHQLKLRLEDDENDLLLTNVYGVMLMMMVVIVMIVLATPAQAQVGQ